MDQVRYGIIGCGHMAVEHLTDILALEGTAVVAGADTDEGSRTNFSEIADGITMFDNHVELLESGMCDGSSSPVHVRRGQMCSARCWPTSGVGSPNGTDLESKTR